MTGGVTISEESVFTNTADQIPQGSDKPGKSGKTWKIRENLEKLSFLWFFRESQGNSGKDFEKSE